MADLRVGVAVPAAGVGERLGGVRKAFLEIRGEPLLLHALRPFLSHSAVRRVAVALPVADSSDPPEWLETADPRITIVAGGETRAHSVKAALDALEGDVDLVLVHDAARPLVRREVIDRCIEGAAGGEGVVAAWPVVDTLKEVDPARFIVSTPDRSRLWRAQTPQGFPFGPLRDAYHRALLEGFAATDDAAVFTHFGGRVKVVEGTAWNLKVTYPPDVRVVEALLDDEESDAAPGAE